LGYRFPDLGYPIPVFSSVLLYIIIIALMRQNNFIPLSDYCWVYITCERLPSPLFHIGAAMDLPQLLNENSERELLYYRQFPNMLDGMAHKLLLAKMNEESLKLLIRGMNPGMRDLNKDFNTHNSSGNLSDKVKY